MLQIAHACVNCDTQTRSRKREFSAQAWSALLTWEEIEKDVIDQPICDACYDELRDILIDRQTEIDNAARQPAPLRAVAGERPRAAAPMTATPMKKAPAPAPTKSAAVKPAAAKAVAAKKKPTPPAKSTKATGGKKAKKPSKMAS